jgi:hypothetical protein
MAFFALGSARVPRVGFGVAPKRTFPSSSFAASDYVTSSEVRDREDALASM